MNRGEAWMSNPEEWIPFLVFPFPVLRPGGSLVSIVRPKIPALIGALRCEAFRTEVEPPPVSLPLPDLSGVVLEEVTFGVRALFMPPTRGNPGVSALAFVDAFNPRDLSYLVSVPRGEAVTVSVANHGRVVVSLSVVMYAPKRFAEHQRGLN